MATKFKCKLEPHPDSTEKYIWEIRRLQFENPDVWLGRIYYYCHPPYYKMKAVTNTDKVIHFSFNDPDVPDHLRKGGKGFCHQMAQDYVCKSKGVNVYYKGKRFRIQFEFLKQEVRVESGSDYFNADLQGKINSPKWFVDDIGTDHLIVEINFSSKSKIKKQSGYREANVAAIEVNYKNCYSYQNEKYFSEYSDEKLEKAQQTLFKFIDNSYASFKVLHFPSQKNKKYQEGKISRKAKSTYFNQKKINSTTHNKEDSQTSYTAPDPVVSDPLHTTIKHTIKHEKEATKSVFQKIKEFIGL